MLGQSFLLAELFSMTEYDALLYNYSYCITYTLLLVNYRRCAVLFFSCPSDFRPNNVETGRQNGTLFYVEFTPVQNQRRNLPARKPNWRFFSCGCVASSTKSM